LSTKQDFLTGFFEIGGTFYIGDKVRATMFDYKTKRLISGRANIK